MGILITLLRQPFKFFRDYWQPIYLWLVPFALFVIPYTACGWPNIFLQITGWLFAALFWGTLGLAIFGFITHETREMVRRYIRLISTLKYSFFFGLLLVYLPLTACTQFPLHSLLGGLFVELNGLTIFFISGLMFAAMWSLAFTQGITIDSIEARYLISGQTKLTRGDHIWQKGYIPKWAYKFFDSQISQAQLGLYFLLSLVGLGIMIIPVERIPIASVDELWPLILQIFQALVAALLGLIAGLLFVYALTASLGRLIKPLYQRRNTAAEQPDDEYSPLPKAQFEMPMSKQLSDFRARASDQVRPIISQRVSQLGIKASEQLRPAFQITTKPGFQIWLQKIYETSNRIFFSLFPAAEHLVAFIIGFGIVLLSPLSGLTFSFNPDWHALPYLYMVIIVLIFFISAFDFLFARIRIPFLLVFIPAVFIGYNFFKVDHYYYIDQVDTPADQTLTPLEVARNAKAKQNLVVIASTGGGIWASGWTTVALKGLITERPELLHEIRLLSTVSGGTVGAAHFIHDLCHTDQDPSSLPADQREEFLKNVFVSVQRTPRQEI